MQKPAANAGDAQTHATLTTIEQFNHAFNRREIDAVMALMTADCLFENTYPPPDGSSFKGQGAVRQAFTDFFASAPSIQFETEEIIVAGARGVVRWIYHWRDQQGQPGHVRGVDIFRVEDRKIAEKFSYVKG